MSRSPAALAAIALLVSGCVTHQLIVANPNPTDDRPPAIESNGSPSARSSAATSRNATPT